MLAVDFVLQEFDYIDPDRLAALGASYGGYLVNWINGQTNRFRCLVSQCGIFTLSNMYFQTDEVWFPEWEFGGIGEHTEEMQKWSPDAHVSKWCTPMLVIHGGKDFRVPETEGIAAFTALQRKGIASKFLYFSDEGHGILKPHNSILLHDTVKSWFSRYIGDNRNQLQT
jgi:dipeptidyl aminopeptidase/acylaminoacyl peptidase